MFDLQDGAQTIHNHDHSTQFHREKHVSELPQPNSAAAEEVIVQLPLSPVPNLSRHLSLCQSTFPSPTCFRGTSCEQPNSLSYPRMQESVCSATLMPASAPLPHKNSPGRMALPASQGVSIACRCRDGSACSLPTRRGQGPRGEPGLGKDGRT